MLFGGRPSRPLIGLTRCSRGRLAQGLLDLLFFFLEIEEDILGEPYGVLFGEVYSTVIEYGLKLLDGRVGHPDHRLGLPQGLIAFRVGERGTGLQSPPVLFEILYEVPDTHGAGLYRFRTGVPELHY